MKACGIVAEYNPFHYGHRYHIEQARKLSGCDLVIAAMSGNFVQRGEPAIADKWLRSRAAVLNGADLVLEIPFLYAVQSASVYACEAVKILKDAGITHLAFGSECGNLDNLKDIASTPVHPDHLHALMKEGLSYPKAYSLLTSSMYPNDILAVAYLKQLQDTGIEPVLVRRTNEYLDTELTGEYASASAVRKAIRDHADIRPWTPMADILAETVPVFPEDLYPYFRTLVLTSTRTRLSEIFLVSEGIEKLFYDAARTASCLEEFLNHTVSHRYTASRIRRIMTMIMAGVTKEEASAFTRDRTVRVLAFNDRGRAWLHDRRKEDSTAYAVRFASLSEAYRQMEYRACMLYTSPLPEDRRLAILKKEISGAQYVR